MSGVSRLSVRQNLPPTAETESGASTFIAEYAPDRKRGLCGSFLEFGTLAGFTLGALLVLLTETVIGPDAMAAWGWSFLPSLLIFFWYVPAVLIAASFDVRRRSRKRPA